MLPRPARLRRPADFTRVVRRGPGRARAGRGTLVVHLARPLPEHDADPERERARHGASGGAGPRGGTARAGVVVARGVGDAVVRNRVKRRLRHLLRPRLAALPAGCDLVVRATPAAAAAGSAELARDLDAALAAARHSLTGGRR